jgi:ribosome recycling factor
MSSEEFDIKEIKRRMKGAVAVLRDEFGGLRTGRASPSLLEPITVNAYGSQMPMNQVGTIGVPEPRMLSVQVWDKSLVSAVDKAIRNSNLGLNPVVDGTTAFQLCNEYPADESRSRPFESTGCGRTESMA